MTTVAPESERRKSPWIGFGQSRHALTPTNRDLRCCICGASAFQPLFRKSGHTFLRCAECAVVRREVLPSATDVEGFYHDLYDRNAEASFIGEAATAVIAEAQMTQLTARWRLNAIRPLAPGPRWLDIGCSDGVFLDELRSAGLQGEGIDVAPRLVEDSRRKGLTAHCEPVQSFVSDKPFDVITVFDVLEHVIDPVTFLDAARELVRPGGLLAVTTPDTGSLTCRAMGQHWYFYLPELHLHCFNRHNMTLLLKKAGFSIVGFRKARKALHYEYSVGQFKSSNPRIYRIAEVIGRLIPSSLHRVPLYLYIGEMLALARRT